MGQAGEEAAAAHLKARGFTILERNWRQGARYELDIICREGDTIVFVEVRTRASTGLTLPAETLTPAKLRSVLNAARAWLAHTGQWSRPCRCDLVSVIASGDPPTFSVEHYPHVIELDNAHPVGSGYSAWQPW